MNFDLVKDYHKEILYEYDSLIKRCLRNKELGPDTLAMQNVLSPIIKYYGLEIGCLCNAKGWLRSLQYVSDVIDELRRRDEENKNINEDGTERKTKGKRASTKEKGLQ